MEEYVIKVPVTITYENDKKQIKIENEWQKTTEPRNVTTDNYAILTGVKNNVSVIDLDIKPPNGIEWFEKHIGNIQEQRATIVKTPSGGYHLYYNYDKDVKSTNKFNKVSIDIKNDNAIIFAGKGYEIVKVTKDKTTPPNIFKTQNKNIIEPLNNAMTLPSGTSWEIVKTDNGNKLTPNCYECIIRPHEKHSQLQHSSLFINNDRTVVKTCFSHNTEVVNNKMSKDIIKMLKSVLNQYEENSLYETLKNTLIERAKDDYKRENDTGNVYKKIKPYAYEFYKRPKEFLNEIFKYDDNFKKHVNNMDNLIKYMKQYDEEYFGFIEKDTKYVGFSNGILNKETCEFIKEEDVKTEIVVSKYIDKPFNYETETPNLDKILDYQFDEDVKNFIYVSIGRILYPSDNYGYMLYLLGEAGTGKSVIIKIVSECVNNVGAIGDNYEQKFGLNYLYDKDLNISVYYNEG